MLSCVSVSSLHHPTPASLFLHFLLDSRINRRSVFDSTSYKTALLKRRKEWFLLFFGCALSAVSATAIAFGENTVFVRMLLIPESLREQKGGKKRVQKQFWRRISFWPWIVINPVKIKIGLVPKHQYLWTKMTFWSAEDEFCPCGVGQARHQVPVHMLGCAWVTQSKGKKCVIFESEAGTLEEKHDMTQLVPPFFLNTPKTGDCALIFSSSWHVHRHRWPLREKNSRLACSSRLLLFQWWKLFEQELSPYPHPTPTTAPATPWTAPHRQTETWARCFKIPCPWHRQDSE